jgi:hypothetical protein
MGSAARGKRRTGVGPELGRAAQSRREGRTCGEGKKICERTVYGHWLVGSKETTD